MPQDKLSFSASFIEGKTINNQTVEIFKGNVKIIHNERILYAQLATHYKENQKIILKKGVKMIDNKDSLLCDELIINKGKNSYYVANGDISFYQGHRKISCENTPDTFVKKR